MEKRHIINLQGREFQRTHLEAAIHPPQSIDKGFCRCGCGARSNMATRNENRRGYVRGEPIPYLPGHHRRKRTSRFLEEDHGYKTACWIWQDVRRSHGYGQLSVNGVNLLAHRVLFALRRGEIPEGKVLDHLCRQRACVNPDHLEAVNQEENVFRMYVAMAAEALSNEMVGDGGVYTDLFALEGLKVKRLDGPQRQIGESTIPQE